MKTKKQTENILKENYWLIDKNRVLSFLGFLVMVLILFGIVGMVCGIGYDMGYEQGYDDASIFERNKVIEEVIQAQENYCNNYGYSNKLIFIGNESKVNLYFNKSDCGNLVIGNSWDYFDPLGIITGVKIK